MTDRIHERDRTQAPPRSGHIDPSAIGLLALGSFMGAVALITFYLVAALGG